MNIQIALVGGQLLPVYVGAREFQPDQLHLIVSDDSAGHITILQRELASIPCHQHLCDPFDFSAIKDLCETIIGSMNNTDTISFNLTGGTKIMMLAGHAVMNEKKLTGFYINQNFSMLLLPSYEKKAIRTRLSVQDFFSLSDHHFSGCSVITDFTPEDHQVAETVGRFAGRGKEYTTITKFIRSKYNDKHEVIPETALHRVDSRIVVEWTRDAITANIAGKSPLVLRSRHVHSLFFNAGWWELVVATAVAGWTGLQEMKLNCVLPFRSDENTSKNEIDILLNTGERLIFIECKSGYIKQEDVNKIKIIRQTYGGVIAKSLLVSRFAPKPTIMEKCKELDIAVFTARNGFTGLHEVLNILSKKSSM